MQLDITTHDADGTRTVQVAGEVDVSCAAELRGQLDAAAQEGLDTLVDLSNVSYVDSTGIGVLVGAATTAREAGRGFAIANPQPPVRRVLDMLGVSADLGLKD